MQVLIVVDMQNDFIDGSLGTTEAHALTGRLAAKIKEIAREHQIEIVENKPLARMLYANVDVGQAVPPELYQAVAEVLAFVYHLQGKV